MSGEGNLARKFIKDYFLKNDVEIKNLSDNNVLNHKYLSTIVGILYCWLYYLKGHKVGFINYLPLWNFIIFIFLPPRTILGPITGGAKYVNLISISYLLRRFLFPIFYKISEFFLNIRFKKNIIFSTNLLKKILSKKLLKKSKFNYVLTNFKFFKRKRKNIDFIIYYRLHANKVKFFKHNFIENLIKLNFNVSVVGDKLKINGVKNYGYISKKKILKLQSISKYTICSQENIYSLFVLEYISNHVKIIINKEYMREIKFFKNYFTSFNLIKPKKNK